MALPTSPTFFESPAEFRSRLEKHAARESELIVGFYKRATNRQSLSWPESVDEALCFGWIDGVRTRIVSAKRATTRQGRLAKLIEASRNRVRL